MITQEKIAYSADEIRAMVKTCEKYNKAREIAKECLQDGTITTIARDYIWEIFPELKESEDERIRKGLIKAVSRIFEGHNLFATDVTREEALAWLEKQGEKKHIINVPPREVILSIWDLGNEWKELTNGCISTEYGTQLDYIQKHWHESEYYLKEKQGEKPTDKVEPKFKVGDWITDGRLTCKVLGVTGKSYELHLHNDDYCHFETDIQSVDKYYRLWTIQDAMDDDVLATENFIFIFKNIDDGNGVHYYCQYEISKHEDDNQFDIALPQSLMGRVGNSISHYSPATKEQRDLLFQKMKEAGYEWNSEKKELKKIEVASKENEDEKTRKELIAFLEENLYLGYPDETWDSKGLKRWIAWLEKQTNKD